MPERIRHILEMIRFSHTVFAMPFALLATIMAWCLPASGGEKVTVTWQAGLGILLCMVFARSAAMAFNRLVDRKIDAENPRTATRHLPAGILSVPSVVLFTVACSVGFVASTLLFWPNWLPLAGSVPVLAFLCGYSYTKRFTSLAHYWLGISLMLAPICAWVAIRGQVVLQHPADILPAVMLGLGVLFWVAGFDIIYACQDAEFDRDAKLRSIPAKYGVQGALRIAAVSHLLAVLAFALLPFTAPLLGIIYWLGLAAVAGLLLYEHALVRPSDLSKVNLAFFHVNTIIGLGVLIFTSIDLLWN
ncbi:UbiA-like polyprenyltransferase [Blastopirellula marina]|uniref:4-hydroxybenzoate polyprenyltransferase n=1 Tax=Blastopirellula marina TaxID=124 RepID=A0A2S8FCS2_9BACT|nr:UbiA-like polyprenyltransferase [Blastopirellula marina]PQO29947.1 4-hydroxybenzoate octaprenyltransferase [Blastopirellula marina]PTL42415.1 4-hydroxybenzoate octaprenyltransferase [Blastopirellula marina]